MGINVNRSLARPIYATTPFQGANRMSAPHIGSCPASSCRLTLWCRP
ncbi:MAG: hypothetical protein VB124_01890 [Burkholderia sp.]